jgi:hypothetical protein
MIPASEHVSPKMASFNTAHDPRRDEYRGHRWASPVNGLDEDAYDLPELLREAATLVEVHGQDPNVMADVYSFLYNASRLMPLVECWVVFKLYADTDPTSAWFGKRASWLGTTTKEQAEALAPAIEKHYKEQAEALAPAIEKHYTRPHDKHPDRFVVERGFCRALQIIDPSATVEEYIGRLRS